MLTSRVIPCLDVRDGRVAKGVRFQALRDAGSPAGLAARYEADGADEIVMLDISATTEGRATAAETVRALRAVLSIPLAVGGGIRSSGDARILLDAGADKVALNSAAHASPGLITELATRFGSQCVTASVDAQRNGTGWRVIVRAGTVPTESDAIAWCAEAERRGAGEILLTSVDRDGTQSGYDLDLLRTVRGGVGIPVVASGGARSGADLVAAIGAGANAVLAASILHDGLATVTGLKNELTGAGIVVRR
jgi:cyclase